MVLPCQLHFRCDLLAARISQAGKQKALHHLHAVTLGNFSNAVEAVVDRVRPHTVGDLAELAQILIDLAGIDRDIRSEWALAAAERSVGNAVQLLAGPSRRLRHFDRGSEPPPHGDNRRCCNCEERGRKSHRQSLFALKWPPCGGPPPPFDAGRLRPPNTYWEEQVFRPARFRTGID